MRALIPAAGRGKRMAEASAGGHKELLKVGPLTMIEHALTVVIDAGLTEAAVVVRPDKNEVALVAERFWSQRTPRGHRLEIIFQSEPLGVAHAMLRAETFADNDPLAVIMPDNLVIGARRPPLTAMMEGYAACGRAVCGAIPLSPDRAALFGNVGLMELDDQSGPARRVLAFSPKRPGLMAASRPGLYKGMLGVIYPPGWAEAARDLSANHEGEIDDTDLILGLAARRELFAVVLDGEGFDLGNPGGLVAAREYWDRRAAHAV